MPTQQTTYNSRVTDEALEKKFRDTFKSQGGAELVDDLYASGVIVPVVDFTAAAQGSELRSDLQSAQDFAVGDNVITNATTNVITTPGFWSVQGVITVVLPVGSGANAARCRFLLFDGSTTKVIYRLAQPANSVSTDIMEMTTYERVIFLRSGDTFRIEADSSASATVSYRQIADVNGNLVNPLGFTSS